jgi:acyl carrier protein
MNDIRAAVVKIIYDVCRPERPDLSDPDRPLLGADLDSLDFASILIAIEDKFSFQISEKDVEGIASLNALVAYVEKRTNA